MSKILGIGFAVVLALALVGGSAYILLRPQEARAEQAGAGRRSAEAQLVGSGNSPGRAQGGAGAGGKENGEPGQSRGQGAGNRGAQGSGVPEADHPVETWVTVTGEVAALVGGELTIQTADGTVVIHLGPEWYWEEQGVSLAAGDQASVSGFYEGGEFEVGRVENLTSGESVTLRDDTGRPMWAGRGRREG